LEDDGQLLIASVGSRSQTKEEKTAFSFGIGMRLRTNVFRPLWTNWETEFAGREFKLHLGDDGKRYGV
jgi:hypothetical protein